MVQIPVHAVHQAKKKNPTFMSLQSVSLQKSLVTATTTRRKQQQEMIRRALQAEEERKRIGRENFPMTTVPVTQLAAYEPALHSGVEEHEEGMRPVFIFLIL